MSILDNGDVWQTEYTTGWLAHFRETGKLDWKLYPLPHNTSEVTGPGINLSTSRLMLVTSAGAYLPATQTPFDAPNPLGDYSVRTFPVWTRFDQIGYAHEHFNHAAVNEDPQVLLPINHLDAMVSEGAIGSLADDVISFSGYLPDCGRVIGELIPEILREARRQNAQGALLVPA